MAQLPSFQAATDLELAGSDSQHVVTASGDSSQTLPSMSTVDTETNSDNSSSRFSAAAKSPKGKGSQKERIRHRNLDKDNLVCGVCGDKGSGFHFGAITCESCKAFFRRSGLKEPEDCVFSGACKIDVINRKFCGACRMQKCLSISMKKEYILDEDARKKRKKPTRKAAAASAEAADGSTDGAQLNQNWDSRRKGSASGNPPALQDTPAQPLSEAQKLEIEDILTKHASIDTNCGQSQSEQPLDLSAVSHSKLYSTDGNEFQLLTGSPQDPSQLINMVTGFLVRFIPFMKGLYGYAQLEVSDRMVILKDSIMEIMAIRSAIQYDLNIGGFAVKNSDSGAVKNIQLGFIKEMFNEELYLEHMKFITAFNSAAKWDKPTMILTMLVNLFAPDRPGLVNKDLVNNAQLHYTELLKNYLRSLYSMAEADAIYPRLLLKLVDVRTYGEMSRSAIEQHAVTTSTPIEPLLREVFFSVI